MVDQGLLFWSSFPVDQHLIYCRKDSIHLLHQLHKVGLGGQSQLPIGHTLNVGLQILDVGLGRFQLPSQCLDLLFKLTTNGRLLATVMTLSTI